MIKKDDGYAKSTKQTNLLAKSRDRDSQVEPWKTNPQRIFPPRYQPIFYDHCYSCGRFGHRPVNVAHMFGINIVLGDISKTDIPKLSRISIDLNI